MDLDQRKGLSVKHYTVTCVETCPTCNGLGTVPADVLAGFLAAAVNIELDDAANDVASFPAGDAGHICPECHGETLRQSTVRLDEALRALGFNLGHSFASSSEKPITAPVRKRRASSHPRG